MNAEMLLQNFAPPGQRTQTLTGPRARAIVATQIRPRLFTFKNRGDGLLAEPRAIRGDIGAITTLGKGDFSGAGRVAVRLGPKKREPFEAKMSFSFSSPLRYWRVHSASSFAQ